MGGHPNDVLCHSVGHGKQMSREDRIKAVKAIEAARSSLFEASCFASGLALRLIKEASSAAKLAIEMASDQD